MDDTRSTLADLVTLITADLQRSTAARKVVSIDGRSSAGKSTLAATLAAALPAASVLHTDDLAWWHPLFEWLDMAANEVLRPARQGQPVRYRPPAWIEKHRDGAVEVPAACNILIVEGVGAGSRALIPYVDVLLWLDTSVAESTARSLARIGDQSGGAPELDVHESWMAAETPFLDREQPWTRATYTIVAEEPLDRLTAPLVFS